MVGAIKVLMLGVVVGQAAQFLGSVIVFTQSRTVFDSQVGEFGVVTFLLGVSLSALAYVMAGILWVIWAGQVRDDASMESWEHSRAGVFWWWLCPIANLWMPRNVHLELFSKATGPHDVVDITKPLVDAWWAWFVALVLTGWVAVFVGRSPEGFSFLLGVMAVVVTFAAVKAGQLITWVDTRRQTTDPDI